jgi:hypothetical protein
LSKHKKGFEMSNKLQQAIQATRVGDTKNAQFLLTQAIQEDPDNPQSWYLLSLLVDDEEKKQVYLTKVIELDPDHTKAHEQLVAISETAVPENISTEEPVPEAATVVLSSGSSDLEAQDEGETLPDWMADDLPPTEDKETVIETVAIIEEEVVPDWLEGDLDEDWNGEEKTAVDETVPDEPEEKEEQPEETTGAEKKEITVKEKKPAKEQKAKSEKQLNYMLIGLIVVAIIIFFIMAYMIFTM